MKTVQFVRALYRHHPGHLMGIVVLLIVVSVLEAAAILSLTPVIDMLTTSDPMRTSRITQGIVHGMSQLGVAGTLRNFLIVFLALSVLKAGLMIGAQRLIEGARQHVQRTLVCDSYGAFFNARWPFFVSHSHGVLGNTLVHEVGSIARAFYATGTTLAAVFRVGMYVSILIYVSWSLFFIILGLIAATMLPFLLCGRYAYRLGQRSTALANRTMEIIQETLAAAKLIIGCGRRHESVDRLTQKVREQQGLALKSQLLKHSTAYVMEPIGVAVLISAFYLATRVQGIPVSEVFVMFYALRMAIPHMSSIVVQWHDIQSALPAWEQVTRLREMARDQRQYSGTKRFESLTDAIRLRDVRFAYHPDRPVLREINITIPRGRMVAFVGPSGVGKTTLIDLVLGLHEPTAGDVSIDGTPLPAFDITSWQARVGYVPQETFLFDASIRDNVQWGCEEAGRDEVERACRRAQAHDFIQALPQGYNTAVGHRGVKLSGGQRQRIALARAMIRRPELLILDEATSALDTQSERLIQQAIEAIAQETTVVVVAHRLATILHADYVYVLEEGRVVEEGTYQTLMGRDGAFSRMTQVQAVAAVT